MTEVDKNALAVYLKDTKARNLKYETIKDLLDRGADPNFLVRDYTLAHMLLSYFSLNPGPKMINPELRHKILKLLFKYGADPNAQGRRLTLLSRAIDAAVHHANVDPETVKILLENGADPNSRDLHPIGKNPTPLIVLSRRLKPGITYVTPKYIVDLAKLLIQYGADPSAKDSSGKTALDFALMYGNSDMIDLLTTTAWYRKTLASQTAKKAIKESLGEPTELSKYGTEIILQPGGLRERALRATSSLSTDPAKVAGLCKELDKEMYKDELFALAKELDLDVTTKTTKKELCELISSYAAQAYNYHVRK